MAAMVEAMAAWTARLAVEATRAATQAAVAASLRASRQDGVVEEPV